MRTWRRNASTTAREGDFAGLVAVLDPEVVLRGDVGATPGDRSAEIRGAESVARRAQAFSRIGIVRRPALINGGPGLVCTLEGKPFSVMGFTVHGGKITEINILADRSRLGQLDLSLLGE